MERLYKEGVPDAQAAQILGIKVASLQVAQIRRGLRAPSVTYTKLTDEQMARGRRLLDEGLPPAWVAEDLGVNIHVFSGAFPGPIADPEWVRVCAAIRHSTALQGLHREINKTWTA